MKKFAAIVLALAACGRAPKTDTIDPTKPTAVAVDAIPKEIPEYPAIIWTKDTKIVSTEVGATVKKIYVRPGQRVKKGDLLLELDDAELQYRARSAEKQIASAHAAAQASYGEAGNAARKARIQNQLFKGGAGTLEAVRDASATAGTAGSRGESEEMKAKSAEEELKETRRLIDRCKVTAEIDGEVVYVNATEGRITQKGQNVARISDTADLRVKFIVPMSDYKKLKKGKRVVASIQNHDAEITATVMDLTSVGENHVDVAVVEADIDDSKLTKDEVSASGQGVVRLVEEGGKS